MMRMPREMNTLRAIWMMEMSTACPVRPDSGGQLRREDPGKQGVEEHRLRGLRLAHVEGT
jgi:hypothetical protein